MSKRVLVFGTFDGLHPGHVFFLRQAKTKGSELVVAVARDEHVRELKQKSPLNHEQKRLKKIQEQPSVHLAQLSDKELGSFTILDELKPDIIVLGHDQKELQEALIKWMGDTDRYIPMTRTKKL